jgi:hypothetical protein
LQHFHSKNGKAYLFQGVTNVFSGPLEERLMTTGVHVVADINCTKCLHCVGWRYVSAARGTPSRLYARTANFCCHSLPCTCGAPLISLLYLQESAYEESQKYKEGKFILERAKLVDVNRSQDHKLQTGLLDDSDFECLV